MPDELQETLEDIARRLLILNHKIGNWYSLARMDPDSVTAKQAGRVLLLESNELHQKINDAVLGDP